MGNLRDRDAYRDAAWDWSVLNGCFGLSRIKPTDIDGMVERHGYFLFLEAKPCDGQMSGGQRIALSALSQKPLVSVIVFFGNHLLRPPLVSRIWLLTDGRANIIADPTLDRLRQMVSYWYETANANDGRAVDWSCFIDSGGAAWSL